MITITGTTTAKIYNGSTGEEIASIAGRVWAELLESGKEMGIRFDPYLNSTAFDNGLEPLGVEFKDDNGDYILIPCYGKEVFDLSNGDDPVTYKDQTITVAHNELKTLLESKGFTVVISGI